VIDSQNRRYGPRPCLLKNKLSGVDYYLDAPGACGKQVDRKVLRADVVRFQVLRSST
jgi:hypothetical protein